MEWCERGLTIYRCTAGHIILPVTWAAKDHRITILNWQPDSRPSLHCLKPSPSSTPVGTNGTENLCTGLSQMDCLF